MAKDEIVRGSLLHFTSNRPSRASVRGKNIRFIKIKVKFEFYFRRPFFSTGANSLPKLQLNYRPLWPMTDHFHPPRWGPTVHFLSGIDGPPSTVIRIFWNLVLVRVGPRFLKNFWSGPRLRSGLKFLFFFVLVRAGFGSSIPAFHLTPNFGIRRKSGFDFISNISSRFRFKSSNEK